MQTEQATSEFTAGSNRSAKCICCTVGPGGADCSCLHSMSAFAASSKGPISSVSLLICPLVPAAHHMTPSMSHGNSHSRHLQSHCIASPCHSKEATELKASNSVGHRQERHSEEAAERRASNSAGHRQDHHSREATERKASNSAGHRQERHSKEATERRASSSAKHRQGISNRFLKGVSRPMIAKHHQGSRASHARHSSAGAAGKGPGKAAASVPAAVRMSKAELRRNASLDKWIATATEEDKLARKINRDFSDGPEPAAQHAQQRAQPPAKVFKVPAMKKRKVRQQDLCVGFV